MTPKAFLLLFAILLWQPSGVAAEEDPDTENLKGIKAVTVVVETLKPAAVEAGLTEKQLQQDVELRLRLAGVKVVPETEIKRGVPWLYVSVGTYLRKGSELFAFHSLVELQQNVLLMRDPTIVTAAGTWRTQSLGTVGPEEFREFVRQSVRDKVDTFLNAYLSVNPK
jgi:hypothetical protein